MAKFTHEQYPSYRALSDTQIEMIHNEALQLLADTGVRFNHDRALLLLEEKGCTVDHTTKIVRFPKELVEQAILNTPEQFIVYDVAGRPTLELGCGNNYFAPGPGAPNIYSQKGETRNGTAADLDTAMAITGASRFLDFASGSIVPEEVPPQLADIHMLYKAVTITGLPALAESWGNHAENRIARLLTTVRGNRQAARKKPFFFLAACPSPPMKWDEAIIDTALMGMEYGVPVFICASPIMGVSAPVTIAGGILQHTVENLSFLTFMQTLKPGTPVLYGGICGTLDMRTTYSSQSAAEACLCTAGYACMARYYSIPSLAFLAQTDAKAPDYQAGFETGMGALVSALSGIDVIFGGGTLDSYLGSSLEKLAMDGQLFGYTKMVAQGVEITEETLAAPEIRAIGCGDSQTHIQRDFTAIHFKQQQCFAGNIVDRDSHSNWQAAGQDIFDRAHQLIEQVKAAPPPTDSELNAELAALMQEFARELNVEYKN